jgi:GNAT superfamily N-acetyltransferase
MRYSTRTEIDGVTARISEAFDYAFSGERVFEGWEKPNTPVDFRIGLIVGPSGSGKTLLLRQFGEEQTPIWNSQRAIASQFHDFEDAQTRLMAVGLNNIKAWCSPYHILSTGEQFRADVARRLETGAVVDEFTSVVDRNVAKSASTAIHKYIHAQKFNGVVFASCHYDILEWLRPDWYFDTARGVLHDGRGLQRPSIQIKIYRCADRRIWTAFKDHHYLSAKLSTACHAYLATADFGEGEKLVGFVSCLPLIGATVHNSWREHRTVVLPEFQGMGIGPCISDAIAEMYARRGKKFYSRTAHPRFGSYRDKVGSGWERTGYSNKVRLTRDSVDKKIGDQRNCFSHRFVGKQGEWK